MSNSETNLKNKSFTDAVTGERYESRADYARKVGEVDLTGRAVYGFKEKLDKRFFDGELIMEDLADMTEVVSRHFGRIMQQRYSQWNSNHAK